MYNHSENFKMSNELFQRTVRPIQMTPVTGIETKWSLKEIITTLSCNTTNTKTHDLKLILKTIGHDKDNEEGLKKCSALAIGTIFRKIND